MKFLGIFDNISFKTTGPPVDETIPIIEYGDLIIVGFNRDFLTLPKGLSNLEKFRCTTLISERILTFCIIFFTYRII